MSDPLCSSGSQPDKSLLSAYRDQMLRKKSLAQDEQDKERAEQMIELIDDLQDLFDYG